MIQALILSFQQVGRLQRGQLFSSLFAAYSPMAVNPSLDKHSQTHHSAGWETRRDLHLTLLCGHSREVNQKLLAEETAEEAPQNRKR